MGVVDFQKGRMDFATTMIPCFYVGERGEVLTTGCFVTKDDDSNIHTQLRQEIANIECERASDLIIVQNVDHWSVGVHGRFTPIGRIYALAMLDPEWRP